MQNERARELDEWAMAFRVAERASRGARGWLRAVREATGLTAVEAAARTGVAKSEFYRMERAEASGAIELRTLRRAAEALGCDLIYGFAPRQESFAERVAAREAARMRRRRESRRAWLDKAKANRLSARKERWEKDLAEHPVWSDEGWSEIWLRRLSPEVRRMIPQRARETPFWQEQMRRAIRRALRERGIRLK